MSESNLPDWEQLLSAAAHLQEILPGATLVGGTAVAIFTQHRLSRDADHILPDLAIASTTYSLSSKQLPVGVLRG